MGCNRTAALLAILLLAQTGPALAQTSDLLRGGIEEDPPTVFDGEATDAPPQEETGTVPEPSDETRLTVAPEPEEEAPPPPTSRRARETDPFARLGVRAGGFVLYPALEIGGVVTDNVRQDKRKKVADVGLRLEPAFAAESDWVRHSLRIAAAGDFTLYAHEEEFDRMSYNADSRLRLDVRRSTTLTFDGHYDLSQTSSSDVEVPNNAVGQRTDQDFSVRAALAHRFNRLEATVRTGATWQLYGDVDLAGGGVESNSDRNYVQPIAALKLGYEISPTIIPFVEGGYTPRIHQDRVDRNGFRRDSQGGFLRLGAAINFSEIWEGEAALRVDARNYDDPRLKSQAVVGFDANLAWHPTRLTTVRLTGETGLNESLLEGVAGVPTYDVALELEHALRENLLASSLFGFSYSDYPGSGRDEWTTEYTFDLAYIIRRDMELNWTYEFTWQDSDVPSDGYVENRFTAGVRFRL